MQAEQCGMTSQTGYGNEDRAVPLPVIRAGWPEQVDGRCVQLDPAAVLKARPRSFALHVRGQSMVGAGICEGDIVVGEFAPAARSGAIVVALVDGELRANRRCVVSSPPTLT